MSSKRGRSSRKNNKAKNNPISLKTEVGLWIVLGVSIFLFVSNLGLCGKLGALIAYFLFGIFGLMAYVFPIALFAGSAFYIANKGNTMAIIKLIACFVFLLFLCVFMQMVLYEGENIELNNAYFYCGENKTGGGLFGALICGALTVNLGKYGTYILTIIILIICLVLITEKRLFSNIKKRFDDNRQFRNERNENLYKQRLAEKRKRRIDKDEAAKQKRLKRLNSVKGVTFDTKLTDNNDNSDNINEVKSEDNISYTLVKPEIIKEKSDQVVKSDENLAKQQETDEELNISEDISDSLEDNDVIKDDNTALNYENSDYDFEDKDADHLLIKPDDKGQIIDETANINDEIDEEIVDINASSDNKKYKRPPYSLLIAGSKKATADSLDHAKQTADKLQQTFETFGVNAKVTNISQGPAVTRYEIQPELGVKVSKIVGLSDDIKLNLAATDIRIEAPIPGKAAIGIEVPNKENVTITLRTLLESDEFKNHKSNIAFAVGKDISGKTVIADIAKMPHLLIAGATGSGKSVCINTIIMSILYHADPEDVKLLMIDPKVVELSVYNGIPHLCIPVVTDPKRASAALGWAVAEMMKRYEKFEALSVRDLSGYNKKVETLPPSDDDNAHKKMPQLVIIVDELADLMMVAPSEVEDHICRLAQLARAAGIHLIIATQRPSVNVVTGLIKANMPSRIAFAVSSGVDSRTIIDMNGAEKLLGKGDMLFYPQGYSKPLRVQGAFVTDQEVSKVVDYVKENHDETSYDDEIIKKVETISNDNDNSPSIVNERDDRDAYFADAGRFLIEKEKASIGMIQRMFKVGFNRAARIMDQLENAGVVGPEEGTKPRHVIMTLPEFEEYLADNIE